VCEEVQVVLAFEKEGVEAVLMDIRVHLFVVNFHFSSILFATFVDVFGIFVVHNRDIDDVIFYIGHDFDVFIFRNDKYRVR
jgi:hypothetical protein